MQQMQRDQASLVAQLQRMQQEAEQREAQRQQEVQARAAEMQQQQLRLQETQNALQQVNEKATKEKAELERTKVSGPGKKVPVPYTLALRATGASSPLANGSK